jgi:glycosyltransferase involved in cell wall biosynthesis
MNQRLLIVSPTPFAPADAGNRVRIRNLLSALRDDGLDVHFLHVDRERGDGEKMSAILGADRFRVIPYQRPPRRESPIARVARHVHQLINEDARHVWGIDDWYDPAITDAVLRWHKEVAFGTVLVEYVFFSAIFESLPSDVLKILDTHDRFTLRHRLYIAQGMAPRFFSTTYADEAKGLSRADLILAIQDSERNKFARMTNRKVVTLGHLVHIENCFSQPMRGEPPCLLMVGSANEINIDGLNRFLTEDWPLIKKRIPDARLLIAGGLSSHAPTTDDITVLGYVEDISSAYRQAHMVINPVRGGTGLNIKSIEAMGFGMPLVSTIAGSRGLETVVDSAFLRADGPEQMAGCVERIWLGRVLAQQLSEGALAFARAWNHTALQALKNCLSKD